MLFQDANGVLRVMAYFHHVDKSGKGDLSRYIVLGGDGQGQPQALITMTPLTWSEPLAPGEYRCHRVKAQSASGEESRITLKDRPELAELSFRYEYPQAEHAETGGPRLLGFVNQALVTLTAPERTTEDLQRYYSVLTDALLVSNTDVKDAQETVRVEIPELAAYTEELAKKRNTDAWIAFIKMLVAILGWLLISQNVEIQDVNIAPHFDITIEQDDSNP